MFSDPDADVGGLTRVNITNEPIHLEKFLSGSPNLRCGAVASFVGVVRNHDEGQQVRRLYYECYLSMADKMIEDLARRAKSQWAIEEIHVLHRVGMIEAGEVAVAIVVGSAHREEAFLACRFMIEGIKREVPIWKKQFFDDNSSEWEVCHHAQEVVG